MRKLNIFFTALSLIIFGAQAAHAGPVIAAVQAIAAIPVIGNLLISLAVNAITNKLFGKPGGKGGKGQERSVLVNKQSNNEPVPVVYGRRRLGGVRVYVGTSNGSGGSGTNWLNMALSLCEGETGEIHQLFYNDTKVWDRASGGTTTGNATNGYELGGFLDTKYSSGGNLKDGSKVIYHPGTADQVADATLVASTSDWTTNHRLRGVAYLAFKLKFNGEVFDGGLPTMTAVIDGRKIVAATNPVGTTPASGPDANYADVIYDYLTNDVFGKGIPAGDIDMVSFAQARTYSSTRFNCNGVLPTGQRLFDNIQELLYTCNGMLIYSNGKYRLKIKETGETATGKTNFNNSNIIGDVTVAMPDLKTRFNSVTVDYNNADAETNYNEDVFILEGATYLVADGNRKLELTAEFPYVTDSTEVETIATSLVNQSRNQIMIAFEAAHTVFPIEAGDIITVTLDEYNYSNKLFRVVTTELTEDNTIQIAAQEYNSAALI